MKAYQKKLLIYGIPAVLCCIAAALVAGLAFQVGILYSLFWGMFFGGAGATLARLVPETSATLMRVRPPSSSSG